MNYTIIGGDGKEYGHITAEDIRKWVAENRLNAQSLAKADGENEFRPLSTFPELADVFAPPSLSPGLASLSNLSGQDSGRAKALQMVKAPAIALIVTGILGLLCSIWSVVQKLFFPPNMDQFNTALQQMNNPQVQQMMQKWMDLLTGPLGFVDVFFGLVVSILIWFFATRMMALRSYELAVAGAVLAMIPCLSPCCCIGLPFGIWALVVLRNNEVKSNFH